MALKTQDFIKALNKINPITKKITPSKVSKISHLPYSRCYRIFKPKQRCRTVSNYNANLICKGFHIKTKNLINVIKNKHLTKKQTLHNNEQGNKLHQMNHNNVHRYDTYITPTKATDVILFYPDGYKNTLSNKIHGIMSNKGISVKKLVKREYFNNKRLRELLKNTNEIIPRLDVFRLAYGLHESFKSLQHYNQIHRIIKSKVFVKNIVSKQMHHNSSSSDINYIETHAFKLNNKDANLITQLMKRLLSITK